MFLIVSPKQIERENPTKSTRLGQMSKFCFVELFDHNLLLTLIENEKRIDRQETSEQFSDEFIMRNASEFELWVLITSAQADADCRSSLFE